ncbi:MAG TPA: hypothetical protein VJ757_11360 [Pseudonocardiaceae bacterium]|nr:hypothetical protein [Pseudonocardiaceae bacterium]
MLSGIRTAAIRPSELPRPATVHVAVVGVPVGVAWAVVVGVPVGVAWAVVVGVPVGVAGLVVVAPATNA